MANVQQPQKSFGELLLSIPRTALFGLLFLATTIPLFMTVSVPNKPTDAAADLYAKLNQLPEGSTVVIQSDWTNSTRGESRGQFDALLRILMRRNVKFALMSVADPQAPQVARDRIDAINKERVAEGLEPYKRWEDWVNVGYFPNGEATGNVIAQNIGDAFRNKRDNDLGGVERSVMESPVLKDIVKVGDLSGFIVITGTKSIIIALERLYGKVPLLGMVTGVMGPETLNYYISGQLGGLSAGLKGVADMEAMMEWGLNVKGEDGTIKNEVPNKPEVPPIEGVTLAQGTKYVFTLHSAIFLMIFAVIAGNIGVALTRKRGNA